MCFLNKPKQSVWGLEIQIKYILELSSIALLIKFMWANTFSAFFSCLYLQLLSLPGNIHLFSCLWQHVQRKHIWQHTFSCHTQLAISHLPFPVTLFPCISLRTQPPTHESTHEVYEMHERQRAAEQILIRQQSGALSERQRCPVMNANTNGEAHWHPLVLLQTGLPNNVALRPSCGNWSWETLT